MMIGLGRYNLLFKLGQGGMGTVFLARHKTLRRYCAVKVINPQLARDQSSAERFLREARATASLSHPNLVNVFDCDQHEEQYFIAMEYIEGKTLGQILRHHGAVPLPLALYWLHQAISGLQYLHQKKIVHRDIKPDNMIIDAAGNLKLMDLGLAKDHFEGDQSMTVTGMVMGSPHYMSPEQIHDAKTADGRSDIYSFGITLYQMVVGSVPFQQTSAAAICVAHLQEPIPSVNFPDADLTYALDTLISKMAAKKKEDRFQTTEELLSVLQTWVENYPMDDASNEYFSRLGMETNKITALLQRENIDESQVDSDLEVVENSDASPHVEDSFTWKKVAIWGAATVILMYVAVGGALAILKSKKTENPTGLKPVEVGGSTNSPVATKPPPSPAQPPQRQDPVPTKPLPVVATSVPVAISPKLGSLLVRTDPPRALVSFQSQVDKGPAAFNNIPAGSYKIHISMDGFQDEDRKVVITEGNLTEMNVKLVALPGTLQVQSQPVGAQVFVNGKPFGITPCEVPGSDGESVDVRLQMDGFYEESFTSCLSKDGSVKNVILRAIPRPEVVERNPANFPPQPPPVENQVPDVRRQVHDDIGRLLDHSRTIREEYVWKKAKRNIINDFEVKLTRLNGNPNNPLPVKTAVNAISMDLEDMRRMSDAQYIERRDDLIQKIVAECMKVGKPPQMNDNRGF